MCIRDRYICDRFLPDKAIDLIDEAASRLRIEIDSLPAELDEQNRKIRQLEIEQEAIRRENDQVKALDLSHTIADLEGTRNELKAKWENEVLVNLKTGDKRAFVIGHPDLKNTQIPARDAKASGSIIRSNFYPNCSYMTNWVNIEDTITWDAEVAEDGNFEVIVYYTCAKDAIGSEIELSFSNSKISKNITESIGELVKKKLDLFSSTVNNK